MLACLLAQVVFAVRLNLILLALAVPVITRQQGALPLHKFLYVTVLSGGWIAGVALTAVFLPLRLRHHALLCAAVAAVVPWNAARICGEGFMRQGLSAGRLTAALQLLQRLGVLRPVRARLAGLPPAATCQAVLTSFHYLVGLVLPTALVLEVQLAASKRLKRMLQSAQPRGSHSGSQRGLPEAYASPGRSEWIAIVNRQVVYIMVGELVVAGVLWAYAVLGTDEAAAAAVVADG
jgi:hypothetical protein